MTRETVEQAMTTASAELLPNLPWDWRGNEARREERIVDCNGQTVLITHGTFYGYATELVDIINAAALTRAVLPAADGGAVLAPAEMVRVLQRQIKLVYDWLASWQHFDQCDQLLVAMNALDRTAPALAAHPAPNGGAVDEAILATMLASTYADAVSGKVRCKVDCFKARLRQEGYQIAALAAPASQPAADADDWRDRFWQIVDSRGLLGLPSDEWNALRLLVNHFAAQSAADAEVEAEVGAVAAEVDEIAKAMPGFGMKASARIIHQAAALLRRLAAAYANRGELIRQLEDAKNAAQAEAEGLKLRAAPAITVAEERDRLRAALEQAASWFAGYSEGHRNKGDMEKALRNEERAAYCNAAIRARSAAPARGPGEDAVAEWKVGDKARVVSDNKYGDGAADIGIEFAVEGVREGSDGLVLLTGAATRGFDGFYANRCERVERDALGAALKTIIGLSIYADRMGDIRRIATEALATLPAADVPADDRAD